MEKAIKGEIFRKTVHILAYIYALILYSSRDDLVIFLGFPAIIVFLDLLRLKFSKAREIVYMLWGDSIKPYEKDALSDASVMAIGVWINVLIFGKFALIGLCISILGDAFASLIGKFFGKIRFQNGKSIEGFLSFFFVSVILGILSPEIGLCIIVSGFITALVELTSPPLENFTLGFTSSLVFSISYLLTTFEL